MYASTYYIKYFVYFPGNGLIDESEFLQWVAKIQALRDETEESSSKTEDGDDGSEDLIAAFRYDSIFWNVYIEFLIDAILDNDDIQLSCGIHRSRSGWKARLCLILWCFVNTYI